MAKNIPRLAPRQFYYAGALQPALTSATPARTFDSIDPSTARPLATIPTAAPADVDAAVRAAASAFPAWSRTPPVQRARILHRAAALIRARNDELAALETLDTGRPLSETSAVDLVTGADALEYYANLVGSGGLAGERVQLREDAWCVSTKEPLGVCAGIGAWNYPIQMYVFHPFGSAVCSVECNPPRFVIIRPVSKESYSLRIQWVWWHSRLMYMLPWMKNFVEVRPMLGCRQLHGV